MKPFENVVAVVTGGAGFIGSHIADRLLCEGAHVRVVDDLSTSDGSNIPKRAQFFKLNVASDALDEALKGAEYVFHTAAIPRTQHCVENPLECHHANAYGTLRLLDECRRLLPNLKKFIYSSSCAIYGRQTGNVSLGENAPLLHGTPYALQKLIGEQYTQMYAQLYSVPTLSLRYANVYGTKRQSEKGGYPNVLAAFSRQKRENGGLQITGDGEQSRDFVHVFDVLEANLAAATHLTIDGSAYNIGTGVGTSMNTVAQYFDCPVTHIAPRPGEARHLVLDATRAKEVLGWSPEVSLDEGMHIYFNS